MFKQFVFNFIMPNFTFTITKVAPTPNKAQTNFFSTTETKINY